MVRAIGPDGTPSESARAYIRGQELVLLNPQLGGGAQAVVLPQNLPNSVFHYPEYVISWELSPDNGRTWISPTGARQSINTLYVTYANPPRGFPALETFLYISTRSASGLAAPAAVVDGVFSDFLDLDVRKRNGSPLQYYGNWSISTVTHGTVWQCWNQAKASAGPGLNSSIICYDPKG